MQKLCSVCNKELDKSQSIYLGYDHVCCSNMCRIKIAKIIAKNDAKMINPFDWKNYVKENISDDDVNKISNTISKTFIAKEKRKSSPFLKKTKSYKKEISEVFLDTSNNDISENKYECISIFSTLRQYLNFKALFDISNLSKVNLSLSKSMLVITPNNLI